MNGKSAGLDLSAPAAARLSAQRVARVERQRNPGHSLSASWRASDNSLFPRWQAHNVAARRLLRHAKIVRALQIEPELRAHAEPMAEPQGCVARDCPARSA